MKIVNGVLIFLAGGAIGSFVTYRFLEEKKNETIRKETEIMRDYYEKKLDKISEIDILEEKEHVAVNNINPTIDKHKPSVADYVSLLERTKYRNLTVDELRTEVEKIETITPSLIPYVIAPDVFGDKDGYDTVTLYYHNDKVLTDENNEEVGIIDTVGKEALLTFGEYEDDAIYVRNNNTKTDYEVLLIDSLFYEVKGLDI